MTTGATTARRRATAETEALAAVHEHAKLLHVGPWRGQERPGGREDVLRILRHGL